MYTLLAVSLGIASLLILLHPFIRARTKGQNDDAHSYLHDLTQIRNSLFNRMDQLHKDLGMETVSNEEFALQMDVLRNQIALNLMEFGELEKRLNTVDQNTYTNQEIEDYITLYKETLIPPSTKIGTEQFMDPNAELEDKSQH